MRKLLSSRLKWLVVVPAAIALIFIATGWLYDPEPGPTALPRRIIEVEGVPVSFVEAGNGQAVVLVHGAMGSAEDFETVLAPLSARYHVLAVDRPGFARSGAHGDDPTFSGNARRLSGLFATLGLAPAIVVGHSRGGGVALRLALDAPEQVRGLVLLAPAALPMQEVPWLDRLVAIPKLGEGVATWIGPLLAPRMMREAIAQALGPDAKRVPANFVDFRVALWSAPRSIATHARQSVTSHEELSAMESRYADLRLPVAILTCDHDPFEERQLSSRRLAERIPGAQLMALDDCGHYIQYSNPEQVLRAVERMAAGL